MYGPGVACTRRCIIYTLLKYYLLCILADVLMNLGHLLGVKSLFYRGVGIDLLAADVLDPECENDCTIKFDQWKFFDES